jgi:DNA-binding transcriptional MerR regulator
MQGQVHALRRARAMPILLGMPAIRTNAAAAMLGVSPNTLRSWERRFGYPSPQRTPGGHRQFELAEIEALRAAFAETQNVSSAIAVAQERGAGPATPMRLSAALMRFDQEAADRLLEESLATRSLERTVEEVLLPGLAELAAPGDGETAEYGFAWRWATGWLAVQTRLAPPAWRPEGVLLFDASAPVDLDALHAQAFELLLRRGGLRVLSLTVTLEPTRLVRALHALEPAAVVLTGRRASRDAFGRLVYAARRQGGEGLQVLDFRGALGATGASTVPSLGDTPLAARDALLAALAGEAIPQPARRLRVASA